MKHRFGAYRRTAAGGALLFILGVALIVLLLGPSHDERAAFIVIAIVLATLLVNVVPAGRSGRPPCQPGHSEHEREARAEGERHPDGGDPSSS